MRVPNTQDINNKFKRRIARKSWAFEGLKSSDNFTHGYHRYPAKFLPQLVTKIIEKYTLKDDKIADLFAGCGTTLVEGKLQGRRTIGVDINPVAELITRVKIKPIAPTLLDNEYSKLVERIKLFSIQKKYALNNHPRIDYWFTEENKNKIAFLYAEIALVENKNVKEFLLCTLSHVLKNCSRWLQDGTKPQIDPNKENKEVFSTFAKHAKKMIKKNREFYEFLKKENILNTKCEIKLADARKTRIRKGSVNAIITSPPYVTSYEYADIHQLTAYWYEYMTDIAEFRKKFIGTFYSLNKRATIPEYCPTAKMIVSQLTQVDKRCSDEVANYFLDMLEVAKEMFRILSTDGTVCLVIGNTELKNVKIKSAESFAEMLYAVGFEIEEVIKRNVSSKIIPTIRNKTNGKFTTKKHKNKKLVYPEEFIIIARKAA